MPYEYSELRILKEIVQIEGKWPGAPPESEWHPAEAERHPPAEVERHPVEAEWYTASYAVVRTGGNLLTDIDDEITEDLAGGINPLPLRFTNAGEDDVLYRVYLGLGLGWPQARAARILLSLFDKEDLECPVNCVSTVVAAEGRQVLAMDLLAYELMSVEEAADFLDISRQTVSKYTRRLEESVKTD